MPSTKYLDFALGNNANNGSSWALAKKTRDGFAAGALAAGDTVLMAKSSEPTNLGVTGKWTQYPLGGTRALTSTNATPIVVTITAHGYSDGDIVAIHSHNQYEANGYWTITKLTNNTFSLDGSIGGASGGTSSGACYLANAACVLLNTAVNKTIDLCNKKWTAGTNCTTTQYNYGKNTGFYVSTNASVTSAQKIAYKTLPATLNLGTLGYQQITFWLYSDTALTDGLLTIKLCSDPTGDTALDTLSVPKMAAGKFFPVTIDKGSLLSDGVNSIAIYCTASWASKTYAALIHSSISACKPPLSADSLTCRSLIGRSSGNGGKWYPIGTINERIVSITADNTQSIQGPIAYAMAGGTNVSTYKRECILLDYAVTYPVGYENNAGTDGNLIMWKGGIDTTSDLQTGETWIDLISGSTNGLWVHRSYNKIERLSCVRCLNGLYCAPAAAITGSQIFDAEYIGCNRGIGVGANGSYDVIISNCHAHNNSLGLYFTNAGNYRTRFTADLDVSMCNGFAINFDTTISGISFKSIEASGCYSNSAQAVMFTYTHSTILVDGNFNIKYTWTGSALACSGIHGLKITGTLDVTGSQFNNPYTGYLMYLYGCSDVEIKTLIATGIKEAWQTYAYGSYSLYNSLGSETYILGGNLTGTHYGGLYSTGSTTIHFKDVTFHTTPIVLASTEYWAKTVIYSMNHNGSAGVHKTFYNGGEVNSETTVRHTASGISWKISPTSTTLVTDILPMRLSLGKVICGAGVPVTVNVWLRRSNTGLTLQLVAGGGYVSGVSADVVSSMTEVADTWQQVSVSFNPNEDGAIPIEVRAYGGSAYNGYVDDMSVS